MALRGRPANWIPPETKRLLDEQYQGSIDRACRKHGLVTQSIKDIYKKNPAGIQNVVGFLTALGFQETDPAMKVLLEMAGQNTKQALNIVPRQANNTQTLSSTYEICSILGIPVSNRCAA